ncbi:MAG: TRAP transporter small permease [Cardiobacteriaceae bacterium]|nr:TRAP transporter small permease [Cardiobacteriaceae bacterium]
MGGATHSAGVARLSRATSALLLGVAGTALVLLMLIGFGDVFARYFFSASIVQREELFNVLLITVFACSFPVITVRREHLDVDLLDGLFKTPFKRKLQLFVIDLAVGSACLGMSYWMYDKGGRISRPGREVMYEELGVRQGLFAYGFAAMLFVVGIIMLLWTLWHLYTLVSGRNDHLPELGHKDNL